MASLKERLFDWIDFDGAAHHVGVCLGFWREWGAPLDQDPWGGTKHIFWSSTPVGESISWFLDNLVKAEVLELDESGIKYRWNPNYVGDADMM